MSTKIQITKTERALAKKELRKNAQSLSRNKPKRITKQVRIGIEPHRLLRLEAPNRFVTISKLLDDVIAAYFAEVERSQGQTKAPISRK